MKIKLSFVLAVFAAVSLAASLCIQAQGDDPSIKATTVFGKVSEINAAAGQIAIKTAAGSVVVASVNEKTTYQRMPPGETDRSKAVPTSLTEITVGDGVVARGFVASDRKSVPAQQIIVVSQSDIAKKQEQERTEWRRRGVSGIVASLNPAAKEVTITSRSLMGVTQAIIIPITDKVRVRRYPPDSIPKYSEARPSKFEEVKVGDQLRALGDKSADGTRVTAEEVVFGTFKIVGGTVSAIDLATNTITVSDLKTKQPMTLVLKPDTVVRRFQMMFGGGGMGAGAGAGGGQGAGANGQRPNASGSNLPGSNPPGGQGNGPGGQGPRPGGGMNMADLIDRLPTIAISDLKVGDMIIVSTLPGADQNRLTAISMVAGIEPLLQMLAARQATGGQPRPQNVDLNSNFGGMFGGVGVP